MSPLRWGIPHTDTPRLLLLLPPPPPLFVLALAAVTSGSGSQEHCRGEHGLFLPHVVAMDRSATWREGYRTKYYPVLLAHPFVFCSCALKPIILHHLQKAQEHAAEGSGQTWRGWGGAGGSSSQGDSPAEMVEVSRALLFLLFQWGPKHTTLDKESLANWI